MAIAHYILCAGLTNIIIYMFNIECSPHLLRIERSLQRYADGVTKVGDTEND